MSVIKTIELVAQSNKGWEDAAQLAIEEACKSVRDIDSLYAGTRPGPGRHADRDGGQDPRRFRINARISFVVRDDAVAVQESKGPSSPRQRAGSGSKARAARRR